jgi:predicted  nucleic acid-binding Zn-ribbon protein
MENKIFELADKLKELKDEKKCAEQVIKDISEKISEVEATLAKVMTDSETQSFTRNGTMFCLTLSTKASAVAGLKNELYKILKKQGYGDLVYETVNAQSLSSFVKEQILENEDKLPFWLDGLVNLYEKVSVSVRKSSGKSGPAKS